jgi:MSHA biogenesis protein MshE
MTTLKNEPLGTALVAQGFLTQERLNEALAEQKKSGRMLGRILTENAYVTEEQMAKTLAVQQSVPFVDLRRHDISPTVVCTLSEVQARRFRAVVLEKRSDSFLVGFVDPSSLRAQDELAGLLGKPLDVCVITADQFNKTIDRVYRKTEQLDEYAKEVQRDIERERGVVDINQMTLAIDDVEAPVVKLLQTIFEEAVQMRASDIHIEPEESKLVVRFRIDGVLHQEVEADAKITSALNVRLKLLAGLDIAEKRLPQDGSISIKVGSERVDIRLSTIPALFGESIVMRLLIQSQGLRALETSGMPKGMLDQFKRILASPHGIVLVTGPTGCGKTTTLYGALDRLNQRNVKILTVEDPVEYRLAGITQVQVNEKIGLTFARMLRSFLRQDPDILLVGEIRDKETAQIAARAAMTGHLVLSTLHTNDAASTPGRLIDMEVPSYLVASTVLAVLSQRLLRLNCSYCAEPYVPTASEMDWLGHWSKEDLSHAKFRRGKGCSRCNGIGYSGRTGVFELLELTPALAEELHRKDPAVFEQAARNAMGKTSIDHHAISLVIEGKTTISEAMTVVSSVGL